MISVPDRREAASLIAEAVHAGARCAPACRALGLSVRTYQRWLREGEVKADGRPLAVRPEPANKLTPTERDQVLARCHAPEFASLPPSQIVPRLADRGEYLASESSFYRILKAAGEQQHRGRPHPRRATAPNGREQKGSGLAKGVRSCKTTITFIAAAKSRGAETQHWHIQARAPQKSRFHNTIRAGSGLANRQ